MGQDETSWYGEGTWTVSLGTGKGRVWQHQRRWKTEKGGGCSCGRGGQMREMRGAEYGIRGWRSNSGQSQATGPAQYIGASFLRSLSRLLPCTLSSPLSTSSLFKTTRPDPYPHGLSRHTSLTTRLFGRSLAAPHQRQSPDRTRKPATTTTTLSF